MIKHHPTDDMLLSYVKSGLPISVSVAVSIHAEMCDVCREKIALMTEVEATSVLINEPSVEYAVEEAVEAGVNHDFSDIVAAITQDESRACITVQEEASISVGNSCIQVPRAIANIEQDDWLNLGKLSRSRLQLDDGAIRSSLLYIDADGDVPHHTHNGFEITLLLDGTFSDEFGDYQAGDFIWLDGNHNHQPKTQEGCLCYTVVSDALHFNQGLSRILNPIGKLIY